MALKLNFREVTPEDTEILRMIALRNGKAEDYLCCDVTNEDGVTQTTWYSKADVALWGEDYIRAHTTMKYSDYSGWIIILDMEPWNDAQASPRKKKKRDSFPQIPTWLEGHVKERKQKRLPTVTLCSSAGNELLEVWYYGDLLTVKGESQFYIIDRGETPGLVAARDPESGEEFVIFDGGQHGYDIQSPSCTHILLENVPGLAPTSLLLLEQLRTIDRKRLRGYIGRISKEKMLEVDAALAISIGIGYPNERRTHNV